MQDKSVYMSQSIEKLEHHLEQLGAERKILASKLKVVNTPAHKHLVADYKAQLQSVKDQYVLIKVGEHPTKVCAILSKLQGREEELQRQLHRWTGTKSVVNTLDEEVKVCEEILRERKSL